MTRIGNLIRRCKQKRPQFNRSSPSERLSERTVPRFSYIPMRDLPGLVSLALFIMVPASLWPLALLIERVRPSSHKRCDGLARQSDKYKHITLAAYRWGSSMRVADAPSMSGKWESITAAFARPSTREKRPLARSIPHRLGRSKDPL